VIPAAMILAVSITFFDQTTVAIAIANLWGDFDHRRGGAGSFRVEEDGRALAIWRERLRPSRASVEPLGLEP
jgi:hypothetical protein